MPEPEEYAESSYGRTAVVRLQELPVDHPRREEGRRLVERLTATCEALDVWLQDVGLPAADRPGLWDDWDDDTDWRSGSW